MLIFGILIAYLLFAIAVGKLLAYAAYQDEVWTDIRENVLRPVSAPSARPAERRLESASRDTSGFGSATPEKLRPPSVKSPV